MREDDIIETEGTSQRTLDLEQGSTGEEKLSDASRYTSTSGKNENGDSVVPRGLSEELVFRTERGSMDSADSISSTNSGMSRASSTPEMLSAVGEAIPLSRPVSRVVTGYADIDNGNIDPNDVETLLYREETRISQMAEITGGEREHGGESGILQKEREELEEGEEEGGGEKGENGEYFEVVFHTDPNMPPDPEDVARHMSMARKWYISLLITASSMVITMTSSCWTFVAEQLIAKKHISHEVATLGLTLYVFGLAIGPLFLSPISELYGRRMTFMSSLALSVIWQILTIWCNNIGGMLVGRFLSAFFGSSFLSVAGGSLSDIFTKKEITVLMAIYTTATFLGPAIGPVISAAFYHTDYRWTLITMFIASGVCLALIVVTLPETYVPMLLIKKAKRLRKTTGDDRYTAPLEKIRAETNLGMAVILSCKRPFGLLFRDPMMGVLCFYTGLVLAIIYLYFVAFPYIYQNVYDFSVMGIGCSYLAMSVGMILSAGTSPLIQKNLERKVRNNGGVSVPEMRFEVLFYGAFLTPIGLMIFAWTCYRHVHWIGTMFGSAIFGAGVFYVFVGIFNYTVDAYKRYAASGLACNSFVRCIMAGVFPLFGDQMYRGMGVNWAGFLIAMVTLMMVPVPFFFTKYGAYLRSKSPYAWDG